MADPDQAGRMDENIVARRSTSLRSSRVVVLWLFVQALGDIQAAYTAAANALSSRRMKSKRTCICPPSS